MQEEVTNRTVNLAISTTKLTGRAIVKGIRMYLNHRAKVKGRTPHGKQTVKELIGQNQGIASIPIPNSELKSFERVAKKYGVDFAIRKDNSMEPPRYTVFFKAHDEAALSAVCKEYAAQTVSKQKRPSVLQALREMSHLNIASPKKTREKHQERGR